MIIPKTVNGAKSPWFTVWNRPEHSNHKTHKHTQGTGYTLLGQNDLTPGFHYIIDEEYKISLFGSLFSLNPILYIVLQGFQKIRKETLKN